MSIKNDERANLVIEVHHLEGDPRIDPRVTAQMQKLMQELTQKFIRQDVGGPPTPPTNQRQSKPKN